MRHVKYRRFWITPAQRVETDALMSEVHFAAHGSMRSMWIDREGSPKQIDAAALTKRSYPQVIKTFSRKPVTGKILPTCHWQYITGGKYFPPLQLRQTDLMAAQNEIGRLTKSPHLNLPICGAHSGVAPAAHSS